MFPKKCVSWWIRSRFNWFSRLVSRKKHWFWNITPLEKNQSTPELIVKHPSWNMLKPIGFQNFQRGSQASQKNPRISRFHPKPTNQKPTENNFCMVKFHIPPPEKPAQISTKCEQKSFHCHTHIPSMGRTVYLPIHEWLIYLGVSKNRGT